METKLEVGKEYWLGEAKKFKGIYKGSFDKASYFDVTYGDANFTRDANGYVEFPERGVLEIEQWQFTAPIAMKCTEEQFNEIKEKLVEMGYSGCRKAISFDRYEYLTNRYGQIGHVDCTDKYISKIKVSNWFESFNPDLFLALSAMTDKEDGIKGEVYTNSCGKFYTKDDGTEGKWHNTFWRKATAQEIIEHFEKKEFVLPEKWCVKVNKENSSVLNEYAFHIGFLGLCNFNKYFTSDITIGVKTGYGYTEITFDQFKKYVLKETEQSCQVIPIPPSKQATLFDDRVEITDWKPKEGQLIYYIIVSNFGNIKYRAEIYNSLDYQKESLANGFIKRTESEAKQLVEKLKQAML